MKQIPIITYPWPPVAAARPRITKTGRAYTAAIQKKYRADMRAYISSLRLDMITDPVCVVIHFFFPHKKLRGWKSSRPDIDNLAKMTLDCVAWTEWGTKIKRGILADDSQVVQLICTKKYCTSAPGDRPRTVVFVREPDTDGHQESERHLRKIKQLRNELDELRRTK